MPLTGICSGVVCMVVVGVVLPTAIPVVSVFTAVSSSDSALIK